MVQLSPQNIELELKAYCQKWLLLLSQGDFEQANELISAPNNYGARWGKQEVTEAVVDYFDSESDFQVQNTEISFCTPEFLECDDGSLLYGFYFPVNGEITDLTVEFEFNRISGNEFSATINDIHVL
ncbi:hypothetical protein [Colwellia sp. BRX10-4]|uniref:hypothetical protein n=1 Tax=Colwellia sp. BRX10-4 TaxID=2759843 RepID=UPI0015F72906|nr:hypothetical protein [Colwellia sp. BRX10-4]MBA6399845.1 hypothetical protein [Colwellia sp. BRX10-4]